jgi:hypothetical protein
MSRKAKLLACLGVALAPWLVTAAISADEQFVVSKIIDVPGGLNSFDIGFVDANIQTYVLADRTNKGIDVIDTSTNTLVRTLTGCGGNVAFPGCSVFAGASPPAPDAGPNGVIIVDQKEVWVPDGISAANPTSKVFVIDLRTNALILPVMDTGGTGRADELCEDVNHEVVMVANDRDQDLFVTFWSAESHQLLGKVSFKGGDPNAKGVVAVGGIEQCKFDPRTKKFYLALPDVGGGSGAVVTFKKNAPFAVDDVFPIPAATGCAGPQGLAVGPRHQIVLGCGGASTASLIIDDRDGHVIHTLTGSGGADEVWYNPGDNQYFLAASNNATPQLAVNDPDGAKDPLVPTAAGSHSVAADMIKNQVYVPGNKAAKALCGQLGHTPNNNGCIAVFTAPNDDRCLAQGMPVLDHDDGDDPVFMRTRCRDDDDED